MAPGRWLAYVGEAARVVEDVVEEVERGVEVGLRENVRLLTTVTITAKQKSCKNKGRETTPPGQKHLYFRGHDSIEIHRRLVYYNLGHLHGLLRHYRPLNMHNLRDLLHNDLPRARASRPAPGGRQGGAGRGARGAGRALSTVTGTSFSTSFSI